MIASILCPGPSLPLTWRPDGTLVIAVNRAASMHAADWWAFCDADIFRDSAALGKPKIFTSRASVERLRKRNYYVDPGMLSDEVDVHDNTWRTFTKTMAIVLAFKLGAHAIYIYGDDQTEAPDADGVMPRGANRTPERWRDERAHVAKLQTYLAEHRVTVERICGLA